MFKDVIKVRNKSDIAYGTTMVTAEKTMVNIITLLKKHGVTDYATANVGGMEAIGFTYEKISYMVKIPRVYIRDVLNDKIGPRFVYYYLKIVLEMTKDRVVDMPTLLLGSRVVHHEGRAVPLSEVIGDMPDLPLLAAVGSLKALPEGES